MRVRFQLPNHRHGDKTKMRISLGGSVSFYSVVLLSNPVDLLLVLPEATRLVLNVMDCKQHRRLSSFFYSSCSVA